MPHIRIEYSANLLQNEVLKPLLAKAQDLLVVELPASLSGCRSRLIPCDDFLVGNGDVVNAFVHMDVRILAGRSAQTLNRTGELLLELLREDLSEACIHQALDLSVEIQELSAHYFKCNSKK